MQFVSLKSIVHSVLLQKGYTMHWYVEFLLYARDAARESYFDDNHNIINTAVLTLNEFAYAKLPKDYMDWVLVGIKNGQYIQPLVESNKLNRIGNVDDEGNETTYKSPNIYNTYYPAIEVCQSFFNDYGEHQGRMFAGTHYLNDLYKIIPERGIIQCSQNLADTKIVLQYISNGCCIHGSIGIHPYAQEMIKCYILWKYEENKRNKNLGVVKTLRNEWALQRHLLRARLNPLLPNDIKRIIQENYHALPK